MEGRLEKNISEAVKELAKIIKKEYFAENLGGGFSRYRVRLQNLPDCSSVAKMSEKNKQEIQGTVEGLEAQGCSACKNCIG